MTFILNSNETIHKAIRILAKANNGEDNPEVSVIGGDVNTIEWHNGTTPIPKADIEAKMAELQSDYDTAKTNAANKKVSGKQKLKDLGLDDDEIKALMGA